MLERVRKLEAVLSSQFTHDAEFGILRSVTFREPTDRLTCILAMETSVYLDDEITHV
jgi:hypothetical protein